MISLFTAFSPLLEQLQTSAYRTQHYERLVNNFAASTLIKYCSALQNFHSLLVDLRLQLEGLTEMNLADILVAGHLSRHSSGFHIISVNDDQSFKMGIQTIADSTFWCGIWVIAEFISDEDSP